MVCGRWSARRQTGKHRRASNASSETILDVPKMGRRKTQTKRKTGEDGLEKLETEMARRSIPKEDLNRNGHTHPFNFVMAQPKFI